MNGINLAEIYIADLLGIFLMINVFLGGSWKLQKKQKHQKEKYQMIENYKL